MNGRDVLFDSQLAYCRYKEDATKSFGKETVMVALRVVLSTTIPPLAIDDASNRFKQLRLLSHPVLKGSLSQRIDIVCLAQGLQISSVIALPSVLVSKSTVVY